MEKDQDRPRLEPYIADNPTDTRVFNHKFTLTIGDKVEKAKRPWGVLLLATAMIAVGTAVLIAVAYRLFGDAIQRGMPAFAAAPWVEAWTATMDPVLWIIIALLIFAAGFLLWDGSSAAFAIVMFMGFWAIARTVMLVLQKPEWVFAAQGPAPAVVWTVGASLLFLLLVPYLARKAVLAYFHLNRTGFFLAALFGLLLTISLHFFVAIPR